MPRADSSYLQEVPSVFDGLQLGVALLDLQRNPLDFNTCFAAFLGFERADLARKSLWDLVHPQDKANIDAGAEVCSATALPRCCCCPSLLFVACPWVLVGSGTERCLAGLDADALAHGQSPRLHPDCACTATDKGAANDNDPPNPTHEALLWLMDGLRLSVQSGSFLPLAVRLSLIVGPGGPGGAQGDPQTVPICFTCMLQSETF